MTLKCRTAVPSVKSFFSISFRYQRSTAEPSSSPRTNNCPIAFRIRSNMLFSRFQDRFFTPYYCR